MSRRSKAYWQQEATRLVVEQLIRAADLDTRSVVGRLARDRLLELARQEDSSLVDSVMHERDACRRGAALLLRDLLE